MGVSNATDEAPGRADARANRAHILEIAADLLRADPEVTVDEIAAAAVVSRATIYRHFKSRRGLVRAARDYGVLEADANLRDELRPPGELGSAAPVSFDVADVLNKVPPHLLGEQIVAEAQRLAGVRSVAVYVVDIDGTRLRRHAGSLEFPDEIALELAVGPEIPREAMPLLRGAIDDLLPASVMAPLFLRGRAIGVLLAVDGPEAPLLELARSASAAIALAESYTDVFDATRRRKDITAASEVQQCMLPPRIARISGGLLAGNVLPGYEIGGDWFDYVENANGAWIAVADSAGKGTTAAAIGAVALGAFRAKRRRDASLPDTVRYMEATLLELGLDKVCLNVIIARWHGPSGRFFWTSCGEEQPLLVGADGAITPLPGSSQPSLGKLADPARRRVEAHEHRLLDGERILMISDGVLDRRRADGSPLGLQAVSDALAGLKVRSAPEMVRALERTVVGASEDLLEDDATIVAFAPTDA